MDQPTPHRGPFLQAHRGRWPQVDPSAWVHPMATLIGEVSLAARVNVWPGVVLRGDQGAIEIGEETNLQDGTIAHATGGRSRTQVGARVTVGHRVLLHGCTVGDDCLVGMGAILLDNCVIEPFTVVGAGALVPVGRRFPGRCLLLGSPAKVVRTLSDAEIDGLIRHGHAEYLRLAEDYRSAP